jgi:RimJ/RimL family protein N-acetyltransferase
MAKDATALYEHLQLVVQETLHGPLALDELPTLGDLRQSLVEAAAWPERNCWLLALDGKRIIGHGDIHRGTLKANRHTAVLGLAVLRSSWGQGIGPALMERLLEWARQYRIEKVKLNVFADNERAIALYRRFGFVEEGRERAEFRFGHQLVDNVIMARSLSAGPT